MESMIRLKRSIGVIVLSVYILVYIFDSIITEKELRIAQECKSAVVKLTG